MLPDHPASTWPARPRRARIPAPGALALLAALDVRTGKVPAATPATTRITPFTDLIGQVMNPEPYASAPRVFAIVDNGSDHRGQAAAKRLARARPNAIMIHTPAHASAEPDLLLDRPEKGHLTQRLRQPRRPVRRAHGLRRPLQPDHPAQPFSWKYISADLDRLLDKINHRPPASPARAA